MTVTHSFKESLERSHKHSQETFWEQCYKKAFPTLASITGVPDDGWHQRAGIDRVLVLGDGKTLYVDEKVRDTEYNDILLEIWSDRARRTKGWAAKPAACDFIAYAFAESRRCYLLPFHGMQLALRTNVRDWKDRAEKRLDGFRVIEAQNKGYVTVSWAIPTMVLLNAIRDSMIVQVDAA